MLYSFIKNLHLATVSFSIVFFIIRGLWKFNHSNWYRKKWARRLSQLNDIILLSCGIFMAISLQQYPFVHQWLTAKLILLVIYILLGMLALHWARSRQLQLGAWLSAILVYGYLVGTALNRTPFWLHTLS
ncbi:MAG: SirB2 family protein [Gammaproteobacteria bacterium]|nr:SirB2 family protein [Gammaproteobacteria bacterium]